MMNENGKHLVLAGAGHAHMVTLKNIRTITERGHRVTVIGPSPIHYYSGMGPGMLGGSYHPEQISFKSQQTVEERGGLFLSDSVVRIDPDHKIVHLQSGQTVSYDVLSCNLGSTVIREFESESDRIEGIFSSKPIESLLAARDYFGRNGKDKALKIVVIGGGPSAAEISGNLMQAAERYSLQKPEVTVFCRGGFMTKFSDKVQKVCREYLQNQGVTIRLREPVVRIKPGAVVSCLGNEFEQDMVLYAQGVKPSAVFDESGLKTGPAGGLLVNSYLQSPEHPEIFGGGDCIYFEPSPLDKVGVYAVRQNPILYHNLLASLEDKPLKEFSPGGDYMLIFNLGKGYGVLQKRALFIKGSLAFRIKDYIDRKFIRRFS
ncbi:NAD(P)/FAD-dependent oxidoreductase [Desulfosediminicola ganghwensis]|uniref:NAD(P)/FAD-dependent oxidoreductase n=1 Tax=Desulfosediminicola ganghwensis TaxID=2569540 RepID=UPI0010AB6A8F|nr:FAD-dependent oxidoreductase [Desulfosediminicola ganghwensis]